MVILINGEKYACASCIRGHRVKKCNHNDRQLVPIVKRGRQVSQCNHCRDLRKTNGTHVKCTCAIASTPNPINGCLCEVINSCSCVASHLQEVQDTESQSPSFSKISLSSSCHISKPPKLYKSKSTSNQPFIPTLNEPSERVKSSNDTLPLIDDTDLVNFLVNDLDKYITATSKNILDIDQHHSL